MILPSRFIAIRFSNALPLNTPPSFHLIEVASLKLFILHLFSNDKRTILPVSRFRDEFSLFAQARTKTSKSSRQIDKCRIWFSKLENFKCIFGVRNEIDEDI